jgi:hypothetical protein
VLAMSDRACTECLGLGVICHGPDMEGGQIVGPEVVDRCDDCIGVGTREAQLAISAVSVLRDLVELHWSSLRTYDCNEALEHGKASIAAWSRARALVESWEGDSR